MLLDFVAQILRHHLRQLVVVLGVLESIAEDPDRVALDGVELHLLSLRLEAQVVGLFVDSGETRELLHRLLEQTLLGLSLHEVPLVRKVLLAQQIRYLLLCSETRHLEVKLVAFVRVVAAIALGLQNLHVVQILFDSHRHGAVHIQRPDIRDFLAPRGHGLLELFLPEMLDPQMTEVVLTHLFEIQPVLRIPVVEALRVVLIRQLVNIDFNWPTLFLGGQQVLLLGRIIVLSLLRRKLL